MYAKKREKREWQEKQAATQWTAELEQEENKRKTEAKNDETKNFKTVMDI